MLKYLWKIFTYGEHPAGAFEPEVVDSVSEALRPPRLYSGFDPDAFAKNRAIEERRNEDLFDFLNWTKKGRDRRYHRIVPCGHQPELIETTMNVDGSPMVGGIDFNGNVWGFTENMFD